MRAVYTSLLAIVLLLSCSSAFGSNAEDEKIIKSRLLEGQEHVFARNYDAAMKIFLEVKKDFPESPGGCFGEMAVYEVRMLEREDFHLQNQFLKAAKEGRKRVNKILQKYDPSAWELFISGALLGLDGFFKARKDQWWDAYVDGGKSRQLFRHVKKIDPAYIDADFGLGMYLYWRSVFTRDLWFLRFFPDKRKEGIAIVKRVAEKGHFSKELAKANLAIAYFEEKEYKKARPILDHFVKRYPNNVILRRLLGKVFAATKQYDAALEQFRAIRAIDPTFKKPYYFIGAILVLKKNPERYPEAEEKLRHFLKIQGGKYWPASAHYWLGRLEEQRGNKEAARREYEAAIKLYPKIRDAMKRVRGMGGAV